MENNNFFDVAYKLVPQLKSFSDNDMVVVEMKDGRKMYVTTEKRYESIRVYPGNNGLRTLLEIKSMSLLDYRQNSSDEAVMFEVMVMSDFISVEYSGISDLDKTWRIRHMEWLKANPGVAVAKSLKYIPQPFVKRPGRKLSRIYDEADVKELSLVLEAFSYLISKRLDGSLQRAKDTDEDVFVLDCVVCKEDGFELTTVPFPNMEGVLRTATNPQPDTSAIDFSVLKSRKKRGEVYAGIMHKPEMMQDQLDGEYYPAFLAGFTEEEGLCFNLEVKDMYENATDLVAMLASELGKSDVCPAKIIVGNESTSQLLKEFCEKSGIKLVLDRHEDIDLKNQLMELVLDAER